MRAILDDENIVDVDNEVVSRRLVYHILLTGFIASQKAFTTLPDCKAPSHGVIGGFYARLLESLHSERGELVAGMWSSLLHFAPPEVPQKVPHNVWYVSDLLWTLLDDRRVIGIGTKGFSEYPRNSLDTM